MFTFRSMCLQLSHVFKSPVYTASYEGISGPLSNQAQMHHTFHRGGGLCHYGIAYQRGYGFSISKLLIRGYRFLIFRWLKKLLWSPLCRVFKTLKSIDILRVGWLDGFLFFTEEYQASNMCSRDTYPESCITKYTCIRRLLLSNRCKPPVLSMNRETLESVDRLRVGPKKREDALFWDRPRVVYHRV